MAVQNGNVGCVELLLQHGANIEAATSDGKTLLQIAAAYGQLHAVQWLLERRAREIATDN